MPELAEVEYYRRIWANAITGRAIVGVHASGKRPFHGAAAGFQRLLGRRLVHSETAAKQMLFRFPGAKGKPPAWLGVHLGMSGELRAEGPGFVASRHDHLVLRTKSAAAVYTDPRMFGRVDLHVGAAPPGWWSRIAPAILSPAFSAEAVAAYLQRRRRAPLKAVLLQQERFPGIGNWMADEVLWRAGLHPARLAGSLRPAEVATLWRQCREVCRQALRVIGGQGTSLPPALNARIPKTWLFTHRWEAGGRDPRTGGRLRRATIGGRTTCWSPDRQVLPR
jgi:formamidopyrimidine-DNA glycosylase